MRGEDEIRECDVLVIGGGMAGLSAAVRTRDFAEKVVLVEKAKVTRSGGSVHAHAYGAPAPEGEFEARLREFARRSAYPGDQGWFAPMNR